MAAVSELAQPTPTPGESHRALSPRARSTSQKEFYRPELDSLRFLAFFGVFVFHVVPREPSAYLSIHFVPAFLVPWICGAAGAGAFGVDLFFALSAYLITGLLLREKSVRGHIDIRAFYIRRILRIWPLYFLFILIAVALPRWQPMRALSWPYVVGYLLLAGNWVYALKGVPIGSIAIPLWSISVEEQFYLFWPPILRHVTRRRLVYGILLLLLAANFVRVGLITAHVDGAAAEYNTFARIDALALGILVACCLGERLPKLSTGARSGLLFSGLLAWLLVAIYGHLNAPQSPAPLLGTLIGRPTVALSAAAILVAFIGAKGPMKILQCPLLTYLGKISYGLYVYHMLGVFLSERLVRDVAWSGHGVTVLLGFQLTVVLSVLSYHCFEAPFLRLKNRFAVIRSRPI